MSELSNYFGGDDLAPDTWQSKYQLKDKEKQPVERTPDDMHRRMAGPFARIEESYNRRITNRQMDALSMYGRNRKSLTEEDVYQLFKKFAKIVPQGSIMSMLGNHYLIGSLSNCFVVGQPYDSYGGIFQKDEQMVQLMKRRGGVGIDLSTLRPDGAPVTNAAGSSTGAVSFMHRFSNSTREVAQKGRRGALMLSMWMEHPEILSFIGIKKEDLSQVTGANISIQTPDDFMQAVENDGDYTLRWPVNINFPLLDTVNDRTRGIRLKGLTEAYDLQYNKTVKVEDTNQGTVYLKRVRAREYFDAQIEAAWQAAEPGNMFRDRHINYSPDGVYARYRGITSNPCGEIFMAMYDACRLLALNFMSIVLEAFKSGARIDYLELYRLAYEMQILADNLIDLELEHITEILLKIDKDPQPVEVKRVEKELWENIYDTAKAGRRTGCGFTALGDMLAALGLKYDSERAKEIIREVCKTKMRAELDATIDMAILRGPFEGWDRNLEFEFEGPDYTTAKMFGKNEFYQMLCDEFPHQARRMAIYGRRNVSWSTVAPTGTVSLMTQTTSGLEPIFSLKPYIRRKKINPSDKGSRVDFVDQNGDQWQEFAVIHPQLISYLEVTRQADSIVEMYRKPEKTQEEGKWLVDQVNLFLDTNQTPWDGSTAPEIDWVQRVEIQAIIQRYTSHSISSTINLPESATKENVATIYMEAWKKGLKGITVYRDGSRSGVMITSKETKSIFDVREAPERPRELPAHLSGTTVKGHPFIVIVGLLEGKPYEIFAVENPSKKNAATLQIDGTVKKVKSGVYTFEGMTEGGMYIVENLELSSNYAEEIAVCRMASMLLRHGAPIHEVIEQVNKVPLPITSFVKAVTRVLKKYIVDGTKGNGLCQECGGTDIIFLEGCQSCRNCGSSKC